jgi:hypothetical protein
MRRLAIVLLAVLSLAACSSAIPRHPAVYSPAAATDLPEPTTISAGDSALAAALAGNGGDTTDSTESAAPAASIDTSAWVTVSPAGEVFSIQMPKTPAVSTSTVKSDAGPGAVSNWSYADSSKRSFGVTRVRFGPGALSRIAAGTIFDTAASMIATQIGAGTKVSASSDVTLGKYTGRSVKLGGGTSSAVVEIFIVADEVLCVLVAGPAGLADNGSAAAFFASLQITA